MKEEPIVVEAIVTEALPNARFRVPNYETRVPMVHVFGEMRKTHTRILRGTS